MAKSLVEKGLLEYTPYRGVALTDDGQRMALDVIRRHRLIEVFLVRTLGLDWSEVHEEAERLEHAVSDKLLSRIDDYLGNPTVDPHGDPIPAADGRIDPSRGKSLIHFQPDDELRILRVIDQDPAFLRYVDSIGLRPGALIAIESRDPNAQVIVIRCDTGSATLAAPAAAKLLVERR